MSDFSPGGASGTDPNERFPQLRIEVVPSKYGPQVHSVRHGSTSLARTEAHIVPVPDLARATDGSKLRALADYLDKSDDADGFTEPRTVQADLRRMAGRLDALDTGTEARRAAVARFLRSPG